MAWPRHTKLATIAGACKRRQPEKARPMFRRVNWSITREILLRCDKVGPFTVGLGRKRYEFFVVAPGLRSISGPLGGLCGARKRSIAVRIVAQRRFECCQGLRRLIGIEQQFA